MGSFLHSLFLYLFPPFLRSFVPLFYGGFSSGLISVVHAYIIRSYWCVCVISLINIHAVYPILFYTSDFRVVCMYLCIYVSVSYTHTLLALLCLGDVRRYAMYATYVCMYIHTYIHHDTSSYNIQAMHIHTYIHTYTHIYARIYIHIHMHT